MSESDIEKGIIESFRRGLKNAVSDAEGVSWDDVDSIKKHKLLLTGIRNFPEVENKVTVQWYLDGDMLPNLEKESGPIQTNAGVSGGPIPEVKEIEEFYSEELSLEEILTTETFNWLREYYEDRDIPFKQIYLANMDIHMHITQCARFCDPEYPNATLPENLVSPIEQASIDMKKELIKYPLFRNLPPLITEFERVATKTLEWFGEQNPEERDDLSDYMELLRHLDSFYYNAVWKPISNRIGYYTIHGPTEEEEREEHIESLQRARQNFLKFSTQYRNRAIENGVPVEVRTERIPKLRPEEHNFRDILDWKPEDDTVAPASTAE